MTTIDTIRARVRTRLEEATAAIWTDPELDEGISGALEAYSWLYPREVEATLAVGDDAASVSLPSGTIEVRRVTLASGEVVPRRGVPQRSIAGEELAWEVFAGTLYLSQSPGAQTLTLWHTAAMTLDNLPPSDEGLIVLRAVAEALEARAIQDFKRGGPLANPMYDAVITRAREAAEREMRRRGRRMRVGAVG